METWVSTLSSSTGAGVMAIFIVVGAFALYKRWIVLGWTYTDLKQDRDELKADLKTRDSTTIDLTKSLTDLTNEIRRDGGRR